ncbi:MAG TPA: hypothetical protein H9894_03905 [Candidatus Desulfovibrio intestinipullorum]|uniref:Uncharacterized protein n=1 Tax=Candidatus Desulfovibrio intestinipullorum TaxID=2838536 RepID=A0A9D1PX09_9BACT|nr:hypothetical protein [Candidatus Desulfovibrio intestinipullorum]
MSVLFASSQRNDMRPLAFQGIFATNCYEQLVALLEQHRDFLARQGMPNAPDFLAEPMHDSSGTIDWYARGETMPVPLASLAPEDQARIQETLAQYARALTALLDQRQGQGQQALGQEQSMAAGLLREALQHPGDNDIYVVGNAPLLINWGFAAGTQGAVPQDIMRLGAAAPIKPAPAPAAAPAAPIPAAAPVSPPPPAAPVAAAPALFPGCLSWLLPLLLLLLLLWLVLAALGFAPSPLPASCFREDVSRQSEELRSQSLADEEARLLRQLEERAELCKPAAPPEDLHAEREPVIPEPEPVKEPEKKPEPAVEQPFFGAAPVIPEEPKPEPKPVPRPRSRMEIPKDAAKKNDLTFLEGCWRSRTDLFNTRGEPIEGEYCFNKKGQGRRFVYERNGQRCSGAARARFNGNQLVIEAPEAACPRGGVYVPQSVNCTGTGASTECRGREHSRRSNTWKATFTRK